MKKIHSDFKVLISGQRATLRTRKPGALRPPRVATRLRRVIVVCVVCVDCDCTGDGGYKCKVVKCPERPVS